MKESNPLDQIQEIRNIMERTSRFISLSGMSGVFAGLFALAGAAAFYIFINQQLNHEYMDLAKKIPLQMDISFKRFVILDALIVAMLSLCAAYYFTSRNAKAKGQTIWDAIAQRMLLNLTIPLAAGGVYCLVLLHYGWFGLIAPTTLIFYGLALLNASTFTLIEIKWLGVSEIVLGLFGCFFIGYGITLWALGFGVLHIIYGLLMYGRYEAQPKEKKYW